MLLVVSPYGDHLSPKLSIRHRGKSHAAQFMDMLSIEGNPMDNLDSAFAKSRSGDSPLLDFATLLNEATSRAGI